MVFNGKPAEVPSELILNLKHRCDFNDKLLLNDKIQIGDKIKISNGPFANFIAEVENIMENKRIWVLMEYMGQTKKLKLEGNDIIKYNKL